MLTQPTFLSGEYLSFNVICQRWHKRHPDQPQLTPGGMLNPSTGKAEAPIRAIFAQDNINGDIPDFIFIAGDTTKKNYLARLRHAARHGENIFWLFRKPVLSSNWRVQGQVRVANVFDLSHPDLHAQLKALGYILSCADDQWQLYGPDGAAFSKPRAIDFVLQVRAAGEEDEDGEIFSEGKRTRREVLVRNDQTLFAARVRLRYGGCVITGLPAAPKGQECWLEAAHIISDKTEDKNLRDNSVNNGLYLRRDLHRLFDLNLLMIDAAKGRIHLDREKLGKQVYDHYTSLDGLRCALWDAVPPATRRRLRSHNQRLLQGRDNPLLNITKMK